MRFNNICVSSFIPLKKNTGENVRQSLLDDIPEVRTGVGSDQANLMSLLCIFLFTNSFEPL